jgi:superfamily II DNA/RNA helicase
VPQKQRQQLVREFQDEPDCKVFISSNAGTTGLNLQAANTVINVDLPWNPAVLEQRIGRAHRMGQARPVQVFVLVTEDTIEERLLATLSAKHELALAALDADSDVDVVDLASGMDELKRRLEVLLGARPEAPLDRTEQRRATEEAERLARKEKIAAAGGRLLEAAFSFLGEVVPQAEETQASQAMSDQIRRSFEDCLEKDSDGRLRLTVTLADDSALANLAATLARVMSGR